MTIMVRRILMLLAIAVLPCVVQTAKADAIAKFSCGLTCTGTASATGGTVGGLQTNVTGLTTDLFTFSFDMVSVPGSTTLWDTSTPGESLTGTVIGSPMVTNSGAGIQFDVLWDLTQASLVGTFLGMSNSGGGVSQVTFETSNGSVDFANVRIASPVPEPGSTALMGTGLLLCGWLLRRKKRAEEAASKAL
jgi:PEP-CTERM motif